MKILVRLPNWLGDMVMSVGFVNQLSKYYPGSEISIIAKKELAELVQFFPPVKHHFLFSKAEYSGPKGLWKFGKQIKQTDNFDLFFSLPDSFSSALMGFATGSKERVGYRKEGREILLTSSFTKSKGAHRVEEYIQLLEGNTGTKAQNILVELKPASIKKDHIVININSEAASRRLTMGKAVALIEAVREAVPNEIILIGSQKEKEFVSEVLLQVKNKAGITSAAGQTTLTEVAILLSSAQLLLTTDSGPAHLANALGTYTIVLFGAGNENNTAPYNKELVQTLRLGELSCEPCTKNVCVRFGVPQCLERLNIAAIISIMKENL